MKTELKQAKEKYQKGTKLKNMVTGEVIISTGNLSYYDGESGGRECIYFNDIYHIVFLFNENRWAETI